MLEPGRKSILGKMLTKEEMAEWFANPNLAMGMGLFLLIFGFIDNQLLSLCGSIIFGSGIIARAIMKQGK